VQHALVALESTLRIADAAGALAPELTRLLYPELDAVERFLKHHYLDGGGYTYTSEQLLPSSAAPVVPRPSTPSTPRPAAPRRVLRSQIPAGDISTDAVLVYSQLTDRAERIKTVLEAKPEATIKDLSEVITDVSEKTIQRELNSLIEKGQVIRQGERRWSKYSLAPS
jgi:DNA-binding transcriptional ArsR family regulator